MIFLSEEIENANNEDDADQLKSDPKRNESEQGKLQRALKNFERLSGFIKSKMKQKEAVAEAKYPHTAVLLLDNLH